MMLTNDQYLRNTINQHKAQGITANDRRLHNVVSLIKEWAGDQLQYIQLSGSQAKGTAISVRSDCDLFISLRSDTKETLKQIYDSLDNKLKGAGYKTRRQNVSIGVNCNGLKVDLVPAKNYSGNTNYHSLYVRKKDSWTQTNVQGHINLVLNSGRTEEIIAIKIWAYRAGLDFPSMYIELLVIEALKNKRKGDLANNVLAILEYIESNIETKSFTDPSNTNNKISDMISATAKTAIKRAAKKSLAEEYWQRIIW